MARLIPFDKVLESLISKVDKELEKLNYLLNYQPYDELIQLNERMEKLINNSKGEESLRLLKEWQNERKRLYSIIKQQEDIEKLITERVAFRILRDRLEKSIK